MMAADTTGRILLVDDDDSVRMTLSAKLDLEDFDVIEAHDGRHALEVLAAERVDLVLSDVRMPHLDGVSLLKEINPTSLSEAVTSALALVELPDAVAVETSFADIVINADVSELVLMARCLIENSAEAVGDSGTLKVSTLMRDEQAVLCVEDDGPGFTDEIDPFIQFSSTKPAQLGLGLCITKRISGRQNATVAVVPVDSGAAVEVTWKEPVS